MYEDRGHERGVSRPELDAGAGLSIGQRFLKQVILGAEKPGWASLERSPAGLPVSSVGSLRTSSGRGSTTFASSTTSPHGYSAGMPGREA